MSKITLTVFLCTHKDCHRAWDRICDGSPGKWLKKQVEAAELPCKLDIIKTDCMDRCKEAANLCVVHGSRAHMATEITDARDVERLLLAMRGLASPPE